MRQKFLFLVLFTGLPFVCVSTPTASEYKNGAGKLEGKWLGVSQTVRGMAIPKDRLKNRFIVFKGSKFTFLTNDKVRVTGSFKVDVKKSPAQIDLIFEDGPELDKRLKGRGITVRAIYKVEGDELTLCFGGYVVEGRPTKFVSNADNGWTIMTGKRVK